MKNMGDPPGLGETPQGPGTQGKSMIVMFKSYLFCDSSMFYHVLGMNFVMLLDVSIICSMSFQ